MDTRVEDRKDIGVGERGDDPRLPLEPGAAVAVAAERGRQHLDGDVAIETRVTRAVHLAHPASADGGQHLVGSESSADSEGHGEQRYILPLSPLIGLGKPAVHGG